MANYFNKNRKLYLEHLDLQEIVKHLENNYQNDSTDALHSFAEATQLYNMILENGGQICADFIEPRAEAVDQKGCSFNDGIVEWVDETKENMKVLAKAGLMGGTLPRKYGGLNLPVTINTIIVEMVSQADASLMNLFGLQDIAITISKFGSEEQKNRVLPKFCAGEISGSMALTEPDAGSDLQAVTLRAIEKDGKWYLDGVKRFITNGCGEVSLVLARSEEGLKGGRGLSMFLYERYRDDNMIVRRIEDKHGIHGSPTCELQFNMAEAELVGKRKFGLIKYVMSLMNGARLAVSAQALGIAQAAFNEAVKYANEREQFGKAIVHFPAVYQMLINMQAKLESSRQLVYTTSYYVDILEMYEEKAELGENVRQELKKAKAKADFLTPLSKFTITEAANQIAYDAVQIHAGCGYMKDFPVERLSRDARITNIYEGTTQLQVVAAIGGIMTGILDSDWEKLATMDLYYMASTQKELLELISLFKKTIILVAEFKNKELNDYVATYLVELASLLYRNYLMIEIAEKHEEKRELFQFFFNDSKVRAEYLVNKIKTTISVHGGKIANLKKEFIV